MHWCLRGYSSTNNGNCFSGGGGVTVIVILWFRRHWMKRGQRCLTNSYTMSCIQKTWVHATSAEQPSNVQCPNECIRSWRVRVCTVCISFRFTGGYYQSYFKDGRGQHFIASRKHGFTRRKAKATKKCTSSNSSLVTCYLLSASFCVALKLYLR